VVVIVVVVVVAAAAAVTLCTSTGKSFEVVKFFCAFFKGLRIAGKRFCAEEWYRCEKSRNLAVEGLECNFVQKASVSCRYSSIIALIMLF